MHVDLPYGPSVSDIGFTASVDASGSKFALERRSSVDLAPAWLSDVRDMKTQMMGSSSTMDALVERVVGLWTEPVADRITVATPRVGSRRRRAACMRMHDP